MSDKNDKIVCYCYERKQLSNFEHKLIIKFEEKANWTFQIVANKETHY